jgi:hypothetical protein
MHSRRGETYIGGDYSVPPGMAPDVHYKKDIHCVDCHPTGEKGMGDMERKASCQDCHVAIEEAHAKSIHKSLDCATCHVNELRGYQITIWGPGKVAEKPNPFEKYSLYYGIQKPPILMKDQKGIWMPIKVWPHSVGNIKKDVPPSRGIQFRWPKGETRDGYYVVGTVDGLPGNNKHLLWLEIEQAAHPYGKSRSCKSCHGENQVALSNWEFYDDQGAEPFKGAYKIVADKNSLSIRDIRNTTPIKVLEGYKLTDFASWLFLVDKWKAQGDFSIKTDKVKYRRYLSFDHNISKKLELLDSNALKYNNSKLRAYKAMRGAAIHDSENAAKIMDDFLKKNAQETTSPLTTGKSISQ